MEKWKLQSSKRIIKDRWVSLRADKCELPNGKTIEPYYVMEEGDWVHIVALDSEDRVLFVRQYRHAANDICLELPCGAIDPGEEPIVAAKRELREETGYSAEKWKKVYSCYANPARQTNRVHCFLATGLSRESEQQLDETEEIEFGFITLEELKKEIFGGSFSQSLHIASLYTTLDYRSR